jgi:hypothetical protein
MEVNRVLMFFLIIICTIIMFLVAPFAQIRLYEIEPEYFKRIKVGRLSFLFRGIGGKHSVYSNVKEYGVIIPMFIIQILGYLFAIISWIIVPLLYFVFDLNITSIAIVVACILGAELLVVVIMILICMAISKYKKRQIK